MQEVCSTHDSPVLIGAQIKSETSQHIVNQSVPCSPNINITGGQNNTKLSSVNCEKQHADSSYWMTTETGFIGSQPSMAEFLTHVDPESPKVSGNAGYPVTSIDSCDSVPEYPWMKEKKTSRKNNVQGK